MADRWNDERDMERWRRERRYGRDDYGQADYRAETPEERSFRDHEHDADWDHDYDPSRRYGPEAERRPGAYGQRDPSQAYTGQANRWSGYSGAPPYGGQRASNPYGYRAPESNRDEAARYYRGERGWSDPYRDYDQPGPRPGEYSGFGFGHDLTEPTPRVLRRDRDEAMPREPRRDERRGFFDRAADTVASWFGAAEHDPRMGGHGHRGKGPKGYRRSDARIAEDVNDMLTEDPYLDASEVTVLVLNGEVTLSGTVIDRDAKHRAERRVERILGVDHVQNNLRIGQVAGAKPFDTGNPLTSPGRGFGDSVLEAQAKGETPKTTDDGGRH